MREREKGNAQSSRRASDCSNWPRAGSSTPTRASTSDTPVQRSELSRVRGDLFHLLQPFPVLPSREKRRWRSVWEKERAGGGEEGRNRSPSDGWRASCRTRTGRAIWRGRRDRTSWSTARERTEKGSLSSAGGLGRAGGKPGGRTVSVKTSRLLREMGKMGQSVCE